ncbi:cysteine-rich with EGF-like domain protein 2 [Phymastichus coffea]|uniref:cysteine-rich with EGF-like domain protein 2 n=1 Tax=Phymastichus coffea TaxID=108790 RepID=UPI00273B84D3|nr:cysteine-rich with EGF-like domain protein 2 [Phymastichus coffea]
MQFIYVDLYTVFFLLLCTTPFGTSKKSSEEIKNTILPPCASCKIMVESFKKGIDKTSRGKFEGGDSAWEEDKLGSYKTSEVRLIEIQENLCKDVDRGQTQCHSLAEDMESFIEEWWFKKQDSDPDLYIYLCIEKSERCCPKDHFGPNCDKCPGYPNNVCNNNGRCKGAGTRKGSGQCTCDKGYSGEDCFDCATGFYESYRDNKKLLCSACHRACKGTCSGGGSKDCKECNSGWRLIDGKGCYDIDECIEKEDPCSHNQFCVNSEGSFSCIECDKSCDGCDGDGPDMCIKCAKEYRKKGNVCIDPNANPGVIGRSVLENYPRYITYAGLAVATGIIFQRNVYAASVIGLFVALYISVSEYLIATSDVQNATPKLKLVEK